jgi:hypothetical protein
LRNTMSRKAHRLILPTGNLATMPRMLMHAGPHTGRIRRQAVAAIGFFSKTVAIQTVRAARSPPGRWPRARRSVPAWGFANNYTFPVRHTPHLYD